MSRSKKIINFLWDIGAFIIGFTFVIAVSSACWFFATLISGSQL